MNKKLCVIDDTCIGMGGTALTLQALFSSYDKKNIIFLRTHEVTDDVLKTIPQDTLFVLGNINNFEASLQTLLSILVIRKFVKIEFDYGFCRFRCEAAYKKFTGEDAWSPFSDKYGSKVLKNIYDWIRRRALCVFYMSEEQRKMHDMYLEPSKAPQYVLSSCFTKEDLLGLLGLNSKRGGANRAIWAIADGNGGWHTEAKGVYDAIKYARDNKIDFELVRSPNYHEFLNRLSAYKGLIFLPKIHDTCPRLVIEAKIMGLEMVLNNNVQHLNEDWFKKNPEEICDYLVNRPRFFMEKIDNL